jgi:hypothetical protein
MTAGFLGIWSDVTAAQETDYLHWLTREHTQERVGVPGFLGVRVFRAQLSDVRRYFIHYRLEQQSVLTSAPYLARLNAPTEWTRRIMPILKNFVRGGGRVVAQAGSGRGGKVVPVICETAQLAAARAALDPIVARDRVTAARLLETDEAGTTVQTNEKSIRGKDETFAALLITEALDDTALDDACAVLRKSLTPAGPLVHYDQVYALERADLQGDTEALSAVIPAERSESRDP